MKTTPPRPVILTRGHNIAPRERKCVPILFDPVTRQRVFGGGNSYDVLLEQIDSQAVRL